MPFGDGARILEMDVCIVERRRRVPYLAKHAGDSALRDEPDRKRERDGGKRKASGSHGMGTTGVNVRRFYKDAPRLPDGDHVDVRALAGGDWVEIEVGPGRGLFVVERARVEPLAALVGIEIRRKWASIVDGRLAVLGLSGRARVFAEDAREALPRLVPDASVRRIFVNFPDPWWKRRHAKRLLVQDSFVGHAARLLEPAGELFLQTDVEERADAYERMLELDARFSAAGDTVGSARMLENPYVARSPRERRAMQDGLPVYRLRWKRR
jgi:tRNA (guanine-N7-)-methyltransferase